MKMKRALLLTSAIGVVIGVSLYLANDEATRTTIANAVGGKPAHTAGKAKPICAYPVNPNVAAPTDCIPAHLANLPPDPGEAGKATIDGIDSDKDGMRDDVQRWIALEWGHSPIAVKGLTIIAQQYLEAIHYGDSLGKKETYDRFASKSMRESACATGLETPDMQESGARLRLKAQILNTRERQVRMHEYSLMFANTVNEGFPGTDDEACGFDIAALAAAEGKRTIHSILAQEIVENQKREESKK